jgi:transcriptional regulator with XRE-family HTH domain
LTRGNPLLASRQVDITSPIPPDRSLDLDLDRDVRRLIDLHRGQWKAIEQATGVSYSWLSKFARGKITNPGYATLKRLHVLLREHPVTPPLPYVATLPPRATEAEAA